MKQGKCPKCGVRGTRWFWTKDIPWRETGCPRCGGSLSSTTHLFKSGPSIEVPPLLYPQFHTRKRIREEEERTGEKANPDPVRFGGELKKVSEGIWEYRTMTIQETTREFKHWQTGEPEVVPWFFAVCNEGHEEPWRDQEKNLKSLLDFCEGHWRDCHSDWAVRKEHHSDPN